MVARESGRTSLFEDLKAAVQIDKNDLDSCLVQQPDLFYRVSEEYTLARSLQDEIKFDITQLEAELGAQFRKEAEGEKKPPTDTAVKALIAATPKMIDLQKELLAASKRVGKWGALKEAYDMRASALKSLTQLYASSYFTVQTGKAPIADARGRIGDDMRKEGGEERRSREPRQRPRADD